MIRCTRYQGLIIKDHQLLLIRHREHETGRGYWVIPGGGLDPGESEFECVVREMKEETNLDVEVERLLFDEAAPSDGVYQWRKSYLCRLVGGTAAPGYEPELDAAAQYAITEVRWFDLRDERDWPDDVHHDPFTYPQLVQLRRRLGYSG